MVNCSENLSPNEGGEENAERGEVTVVLLATIYLPRTLSNMQVILDISAVLTVRMTIRLQRGRVCWLEAPSCHVQLATLCLPPQPYTLLRDLFTRLEFSPASLTQRARA